MRELRGLAGLFIVRKIDREWIRDLERIMRKHDERELEEITVAKAKSYGVITWNFAKLLKGYFTPATLTCPTGDGISDIYVTLVDEGGASLAIPTILTGKEGSDERFGGGLFIGAGDEGGWTVEWKPTFKAGSGTTAPTPDDYALEASVTSVPISGVSLMTIDGSPALVVTGSSTVPSDFTCSEVGIFSNLYQRFSNTNTLYKYYFLLDRATISPISFVTGDPITVQYKLVLS